MHLAAAFSTRCAAGAGPMLCRAWPSMQAAESGTASQATSKASTQLPCCCAAMDPAWLALWRQPRHHHPGQLPAPEAPFHTSEACLRGVSVEGRHPRDQLVQHSPQGPPVHLRPIRRPQQQLRGQVVGRPHRPLLGLPAVGAVPLAGLACTGLVLGLLLPDPRRRDAGDRLNLTTACRLAGRSRACTSGWGSVAPLPLIFSCITVAVNAGDPCTERGAYCRQWASR